jgi:excisionase family DNA binding protein
MDDLPRKPRYGIIEAAYYLDVSASTVRRMIEYGKLEASKIGGQVKISIEALDRYVETCKIDPFK